MKNTHIVEYCCVIQSIIKIGGPVPGTFGDGGDGGSRRYRVPDRATVYPATAWRVENLALTVHFLLDPPICPGAADMVRTLPHVHTVARSNSGWLARNDFNSGSLLIIGDGFIRIPHNNTGENRTTGRRGPGGYVSFEGTYGA